MKTYRVLLSYEITADDADLVWTQADRIAENLSDEYCNVFEVYAVDKIDEVESMW